MPLPRFKLVFMAVIAVVIVVAGFVVASLVPFGLAANDDYSYPGKLYSVGSGSYIVRGSVHVGPAPGTSDVPLNTVIVVEQLRSVNLTRLWLTPEAPISHNTTEVDPPALVRMIFYPASPLQPATTYVASMEIHGELVSWNFTTASAPTPTSSFSPTPTNSPIPQQDTLWEVAAVVVVSGVAVVAAAAVILRKRVRE